MKKRTLAVIAATWAALVILYAAPSALPESWQYRVYSPASALLWFVAMVLGPGVACSIMHEWIKRGRERG
ncbi:hypothetical protein [Actinacidiphila acidipaludis]|uniref:DUF3311 domain-containing protein n=1 Tax=Actinacidiphila acidipaludis TaxID=2873382 RepID=A0ABS7Q679_9ACTN|nr:hypothetical protein [Streptomyces acidipaludis]MBY8877259.1 hypothetical protein [Streptomyces acidipaludis]